MAVTSNGWFRLGYVAGRYQIDVLRPFEQRYWVRATGEATSEMEVSAVLSTIADVMLGLAGVMCVDSLGPDDGYAFTIMGASRGRRIDQVLQGQEPLHPRIGIHGEHRHRGRDRQHRERPLRSPGGGGRKAHDHDRGRIRFRD